MFSVNLRYKEGPKGERYSMRLLTNGQSSHHFSELWRCFAEAQEVSVVVAFLSKYGYKSVEPILAKAVEKAKSVEFFCGLDGYITDPEALDSLFRMLGKNRRPNHKLFVVETTDKTFHPKIYRFRIGGSLTMVIGSANLTTGGLTDNWEASVVIEGDEADSIESEYVAFQREVRSVAREATHAVLSQYARRFRIVEQKRKEATRDAMAEVNAIPQLNSHVIGKYLEEYRRAPDGKAKFAGRVKNYERARVLLDELADGRKLSKAEFIARFGHLAGYAGMEKLWWSDGICRSRRSIDTHYRTIIELIRAVRKNSGKSPAEVFGIAEGYLKGVQGLGVNTATEIMSTYSPRTLAVLNRNPLTGLEFYGHDAFGEPNRFTAEAYEDFTEIMTELRNGCGFTSLAQVDHFLNYVYWAIKSKSGRSE